jgi:hypothetical protein
MTAATGEAKSCCDNTLSAMVKLCYHQGPHFHQRFQSRDIMEEILDMLPLCEDEAESETTFTLFANWFEARDPVLLGSDEQSLERILELVGSQFGTPFISKTLQRRWLRVVQDMHSPKVAQALLNLDPDVQSYWQQSPEDVSDDEVQIADDQ